MTDKQISNKKFRASVSRLSLALDNLGASWLADGVNLQTPLDERKFQQVRQLFEQHNKDVIACSVAGLLALSGIKGATAQIAATLNIEEMENRSRYQGMSEKKRKGDQARLIIKLYQQLSKRIKSKNAIAQRIFQCLNDKAFLEKELPGRKFPENGFGVKTWEAVRRSITGKKFDELKERYGASRTNS